VPPRPRTKPKDERRGDLLDAAESVLVDRGMSAFTVDEVTARAQVAKGTFYLYFQSKDDVLAALRDRFIDGLMATQRAELDKLPSDDWLGRLELWMETSIRGYLAQIQLHDALFMHASTEYRGATHPSNGHLDALTDIVARGSAAGALSVDSPAAAAVLLYAAMHGATDFLIDNQGAMPVDEVVVEARRLCRRLATG
jgi:AcrR family transcriptional regulator